MKFGPLQGLAREAFTSALPLVPGAAAGPMVRSLRNAGLLHTYQPLYSREWSIDVAPESEDAKARRSCEDRLAAILNELDGETGTSLDLGANAGYFTLALADRGFQANGVEPLTKYVQIARSLRRSLNLPNARFVEGMVTPDNVTSLGEFDVTLCLSVFHYWVDAFGLDGATHIVEELAKRCHSKMFFESGQPGDEGYEQLMSFMDTGPESWIRGMLAGAGFDDVRTLGEYPVHDGETSSRRHLFVGARK